MLRTIVIDDWVSSVPSAVRETNWPLERLHKEIKRRTRGRAPEKEGVLYWVSWFMGSRTRCADDPSDPSLPQKPVHDCAPSRKQKLLIRLHEKMKDIEERRCIGSSVFLVQKGPRAIPLEHEVEAKLVVKVQRCGSRSSWPPRLDTALALHGGDARSANGKCRLRPARRPSIPRPNEGCSPAHRARSFSGRAASK